MRSLIIASVSAVMLTWTGAANAASSQLKGQYGFTGFTSCQYSGGPFTTDGTVYRPTPLPTPPDGVFFNLFSIQGIRTFDGNGNGTVKGRSVEITPRPSLNPNVGAHDVEFAFTYTIDDNGGFESQLVPGSYRGWTVDINGNRTGETFTIDRLRIVGLIGQNRFSLTLATPLHEIETQTFLTGPRTGQSRQRICTRSRTLIWMGNN